MKLSSGASPLVHLFAMTVFAAGWLGNGLTFSVPLAGDLQVRLAIGLGLDSAAIANEDSSLALVQRRGHLRVGVDASLGGPYLFWNPKTEFYDGFEWEIIKELAQKLNVEARPVNLPWSSQTDSLEGRQIDLILSAREEGALETGNTKGKFVETVAYYRSSQRILIRRDSPRFGALRDLVGKRVGVVPNSGGAAIIETYNKNRGGAIRVFASRDIDRMLAQLKDRQLDAMVLDEPVAVWQAQNNPTLQVVSGPMLGIRLVAIVHKDDIALRKALDNALTQMRQEGKLEQILRRWNLWEHQRPFK